MAAAPRLPRRSAWPEPGARDLVLWPLALYLLWALAYYSKVFVVSADKIRTRGYQTLFTYVRVVPAGWRQCSASRGTPKAADLPTRPMD